MSLYFCVFIAPQWINIWCCQCIFTSNKLRIFVQRSLGTFTVNSLTNMILKVAWHHHGFKRTTENLCWIHNISQWMFCLGVICTFFLHYTYSKTEPELYTTVYCWSFSFSNMNSIFYLLQKTGLHVELSVTLKYVTQPQFRRHPAAKLIT